MGRKTRRDVTKFTAAIVASLSGCGSGPQLPETDTETDTPEREGPLGGTTDRLDPGNQDWDVLVQIPGEGPTYISLFEENPGPTYDFVAEGVDLGGEKVAAFGNLDPGRYVYAITEESTGENLPSNPRASGDFCLPSTRYDRPLLYTFDGGDIGCNLRDKPFKASPNERS